MHPDVQKLLSVQKVDQKIGALRKDLISIPAERAQREGKLEALRASTAQARAALQQAEVDSRGNEKGIKDGDLEIKKLQERLNTVKNNAEYQAILLQIESVKRQIGETEEEGLSIIERLDAARAALTDLEAQLAEEESVFAEFVEKAEALIQEREAQVGEIQGGRDELAAEVPPELLREYERMFEARNHAVVCPVEGETCTGCYLSIPPNLQVKLRGASSVVRCNSCQRILYYAD